MEKIKDLLIEKTSEDVGQPQDVVHTVVGWCYKELSRAAHLYSEMEISGFAKLQISQNKLRKRIKRLNRIIERIEKNPDIADREKKIESIRKDLEFFNSRIRNEVTNSPNDRGIQEPADPSFQAEGTNT